MEATEFSGLDDNFTRFDKRVVGISRDECMSHAEFHDKYGLSVLLLPESDRWRAENFKVLYGVHAHGHADEIFNLIIKELK